MAKALDLTNQKFGKLTALNVTYINNKRGWHCKCDCGGEIDVPTFELRSGNRTTCGCKRQDTINKYIGVRYGKLTVIKFHSIDKSRRLLFECKCDCGNTKVVSSRNLERNATTHCGCDSQVGLSSRKEYGVALKNKVISSYKCNARRKNLEFNLTNEQIEKFFISDCHYCGCKPSKTITHKNHYGSFTYNGMDRKDSSKGYTLDNVVACCSTCNYLKSNYSYEEFLSIIKKIATNLKL